MRPALGIGLTFPRKRGGGAGGGGEYHADAVHFAVGSGLTRDQPLTLTGAVDAPTGLFSMWWKSSEKPSFNTLAAFQASGAWQLSDNGTVGKLELTNEANTDLLVSTWPTIVASQWKNLLISWNTNFPAGDRVLQVYVNDVAQTLTPLGDDGVAFDVFYEDQGWGIALAPATGYDIADLLFYTGGTFVDLTVEANRRKFIDGSAKPADPQDAVDAFGTPRVMFSGDATGFPVNQGNGGEFISFGVLTGASTSPSD